MLAGLVCVGGLVVVDCGFLILCGVDIIQILAGLCEFGGCLFGFGVFVRGFWVFWWGFGFGVAALGCS